MQPFDSKIHEVIKKFSYDMWVVFRDPVVKCTCVQHATGQPNPRCPKCFGTGRHIKIKRVRAAHQPLRYPLSGRGSASSAEYVLYSTYYTLYDIHAQSEDIFVDSNNVDIVQDSYEERSDHTEPVYYRYIAVPRKYDKDTFLELFYKAINHG